MIDHEAAKKARRDYSRAAAKLKAAEKRGDFALHALQSDTRAFANRAANALGHIPLRQRDAVECARCGASGTVASKLVGAIYTAECLS